MKIWKADLVLFDKNDNEYGIKFSFEMQKEDYEVNKHNNSEWFCYIYWIAYRIPMNMSIERHYDNYKIVQGFDHELGKDEVNQLEKDMKNLMIKQLEYDKKRFLEKYEKKLQVIK